MKVSLNPDRAAEMLKEAAERHQFTKGRDDDAVHVSDLLTCLVRAYLNHEVRLPASTEPTENLTLMLGEAFHAWLQFEDEIPLEYLGIVGTPDYIERGEAVEYPLEIKTTRSSSKKQPIPDMGHYIDQVATYAIMKGALKARLVILHMMGNYADNRQPQFICYDLEFTQEELDRWERELLRRRDILIEARQTHVKPSIEEHLKWACQYCPFKDVICPGGRGKWGLNFGLDASEPVPGWGDE